MILITGSEGFIGKNLLKELKGRYSIKEFKGDIRNKQQVTEQTKKINTIIHLAAMIEGNKKEIREVNIQGTRNIIEATKKNRVKKIIFMSSDAVHSPYKDEYGKTKLEAEKIIKTFPNHVILRCTVVYGKEDQRNLGRAIDLIKKSKIIPIVGPGNKLMQPVYVGDIVRFIEKAIKTKKKGIYDIRGPSKVTMNQFVNMVSKELNKKIIKIHIPIVLLKITVPIYEAISKKPIIRKSQIHHLDIHLIRDGEKAVKDLKHKPVSIKKGIKLTLRK